MRRVVQLILAITILILISPLFLCVSLLILLTMGRPIFFTQLRTGLNAKPFKIIKFRTMHVSDKPDVELQGDDSRLTTFGRWMRKFSIDEWPQLLNILRGDLSFVGPRPFLMHHLKYYTPEEFRRHLVKPGMTGWAQINGRNSIKWEDKLRLDVWYVDNQSLWLDIKIFLKTVYIVLRAKDVEYQQHTIGPK